MPSEDNIRFAWQWEHTPDVSVSVDEPVEFVRRCINTWSQPLSDGGDLKVLQSKIRRLEADEPIDYWPTTAGAAMDCVLSAFNEQLEFLGIMMVDEDGTDRTPPRLKQLVGDGEDVVAWLREREEAFYRKWRSLPAVEHAFGPSSYSDAVAVRREVGLDPEAPENVSLATFRQSPG